MKQENQKNLMAVLTTTFALASVPAVAAADCPDQPEPEVVELEAEVAADDSEPRDRRVVSAFGPRAGHGAISLGVGFYLQVPMLDLRFVYSFSDNVAFDAGLATIGVTQAARAGARVRITGDEQSSIAIRASLFELHTFSGDPRVSFGAGPGVLFSFGDSTVQWTGSFDVGLAFFDSDPFSRSGESFHFRPAIGLELPITDGLHVLGEATTVIIVDRYGATALPGLTAGIAW